MKRAIFVRSKTIVMTELDKKIREKEIYRVTLVGSFVNFLLVIFKFLAGIAGHSAAMLADAVTSPLLSFNTFSATSTDISFKEKGLSNLLGLKSSFT